MKKIKAILFDLDGTLLPMDQDEFVNGYFKFLAKKMAPYGYEPEPLIKAVWGGTAAMVKNDNSCMNEEAFWRYFCGIYGEEARKDTPVFEAFYANEFQQAKCFCGFNPLAKETVELVRKKGLRPVLATNPLFPSIATESRIRWAGLEPDMFELYTTYENIGSCKPNLDYYREICRRIGLAPEECMMVGNDVGEDMVTEKLGMKVFLLTDCLLNRKNEDISNYPQGGFEALMQVISEL